MAAGRGACLCNRGMQRARVLAGEEVCADVVRRVVAQVFDRAARADGPRLDEIVNETLYTEHRRLSQAASDPRTDADRARLSRLRHALAHANEATQQELVRGIVGHYATEIAGHFDPRVYAAATRVLPGALGALLHGLVPGSADDLRDFFDVDRRVLIEGEVDTLRALARQGTVVLAPTHVSNLDSILLGYAIHRLGLPPFAYGAGLNLFTNPLLGFFMRNLGAYTVDRAKRDPLYLQTLKEYATALLERGQHSLFFPGGTRSRSGAVETHLKLGLLGRVPVAFRRALEEGRPSPKVFVVPCTLTYPLVLEAASLMEDHLRAEGGAHYVDLRDEFDRPRRLVDFLRGLLQLDLQIHLWVGRPLDLVGNEVDATGKSFDPRGRPVDPAGYLRAGGRLIADDARDAEYSRLLAAQVVKAYRRDTVALPTSLVCAVLLARLRAARAQPDLFRFLRSVDPHAGLPVAEVVRRVGAGLQTLKERAGAGVVRLAPELADAGPLDVLQRALATLGSYHVTPVAQRRGGQIHVGDPNLLLYYANRLEGVLG